MSRGGEDGVAETKQRRWRGGETWQKLGNYNFVTAWSNTLARARSLPPRVTRKNILNLQKYFNANSQKYFDVLPAHWFLMVCCKATSSIFWGYPRTTDLAPLLPRILRLCLNGQRNQHFLLSTSLYNALSSSSRPAEIQFSLSSYLPFSGFGSSLLSFKVIPDNSWILKFKELFNWVLLWQFGFQP